MSICLNRYWHVLDRKVESGDVAEEFTQMIEQDCSSGELIAVSEKPVGDSSKSPPENKTIADFLFLLVWMQAQDIYELLGKPKLAERRHYVLIPSCGGLSFKLVSCEKCNIESTTNSSSNGLG